MAREELDCAFIPAARDRSGLPALDPVAFLDALIRTSPDCIKILDLQCRFVWVSANGLCALELDDFEQVRGVDWRTFWKGPVTQRDLNQALVAARAGETGRFRGFCPTFRGTPRWWDVVLRKIPGRDGGPSAFVCVSRDVTEEANATAELSRALLEMEARVAERTAELTRSHARLLAEVETRRAHENARHELALRLESAEENERARISRELHDHVGQQLTSLLLVLHGLKVKSAANSTRELDRLTAIADSISKDVHDLARALRPAALDDVGLASALQSHLDEWSLHTGVRVSSYLNGLETRLAPRLENAIFRLVQEALTNVARHAAAQSVNVVVERRTDHVLLIVEDDGVGFDIEKARVRNPRQRLGLSGMLERAEICGGSVTFESFIGRGSTVHARLPLQLKP